MAASQTIAGTSYVQFRADEANYTLAIKAAVADYKQKHGK
jgi:hypothetical protein